MLAGVWFVISILGVQPASAAEVGVNGLADGAPLPDWSGVWKSSDGPIFDPTAMKRPENREFHGSAPALSKARDFPPYTAEYEQRYSNVIKNNRLGLAPSDPSAACLPLGTPRLMAATYPLEFIIQPNRVIMLFEDQSQRRIIWTDGRKHSDPDDLNPTFTGESIGRWEGDTLVVDTIGLRPEPTLDATGAMYSDELHLIERIRRVSPIKIEDRMTLIDLKAFGRPWEVVRTLDLKPGYELMEYYCNDNNRVLPGVSPTK